MNFQNRVCQKLHEEHTAVIALMERLVQTIARHRDSAPDAKDPMVAKLLSDLAAELPYFTRVPEIDGVQQSSTQDVFLRLKVCVLPQQEQIIGTLFTERLKRAFAAEKIVIPEDRIRVFILSDLFTKAAKVAPPAAV